MLYDWLRFDYWYKRWYDVEAGRWVRGKKPSMIEAWDRFIDMEPDIDEHRREFPTPRADDDPATWPRFEQIVIDPKTHCEACGCDLKADGECPWCG